MALLQRFDQEQDFGGYLVVQIRRIGEGAVPAADDKGLEGVGESACVAWQIEISSDLLEAGRGVGRVTGEGDVT